MLDLWYLHRRAVAIGGGIFVGLMVLLLVVGVVIRATGGERSNGSAAASVPPVARTSTGQNTTSSAPADDVRDWNALPSVQAAASRAYPQIGVDAQDDPTAFTKAFATELFTRNYETSTREELLSWAQLEDAPLMSPHYPKQDWTKVLVDSLTDLTWDRADDTPIPAPGPWLALAASHSKQSVSNVIVELDPEWEQQIAGGYEPPDPLATVRDATLTVTRTSIQSGHQTTNRFAVSLAVQLGRSPSGGYGVAATNNYVSKES